ncbi:hypothetical protein ACQKCH_12630 [Nubsella zeaxanthinifaciens]|uniref:hypothetical protein n=1 Tax=Nubsella zeaxanthinifaciens TaxID=392412 RepID=UPI003D00878F
MKFGVICSETSEDRIVNYIENEFSINTVPSTGGSDFDLVLNSLIFSVIDGDVKQIWGFLGDLKSNASGLIPPLVTKGSLRVIGSFEEGMAYRIFSDEQPVFFDAAAGWICIGKRSNAKNGVEFLSGCIAFISEFGLFETLWIKPVFICGGSAESGHLFLPQSGHLLRSKMVT